MEGLVLLCLEATHEIETPAKAMDTKKTTSRRRDGREPFRGIKKAPSNPKPQLRFLLFGDVK